jgi:hypothetical protein
MAPINTPNGNEVSEIVLPNGNTASEVIAPDGSTVFSAIPDSAIHQWPFSQGSGSTAYDDIGSNDGSITGATWQSDSYAEGGYELSFDGTDDYVAMSVISELDYNSDWSVCITVGPSGPQNSATFVGFTKNGGDYRFCVGQNSGETGVTTTNPNTHNYSLGYEPTSKYRLGVGWDSSNTSWVMYVDGTQEGSSGWSSRVETTGNADEFTVGSRPGGDRNWSGVADNPVVYNKLLSSSEFQQDYDAQPWS